MFTTEKKMARKMRENLSMKVTTKPLLGIIGFLGSLIISITNAMEMRIVLKSKLIPKENGMTNVVVKENTMFVRSRIGFDPALHSNN